MEFMKRLNLTNATFVNLAFNSSKVWILTSKLFMRVKSLTNVAFTICVFLISNISKDMFLEFMRVKIPIKKSRLYSEIWHNTFIWKRTLKDHISEVHKGIKPYESEICVCKFSRKSGMKKHISSVHEGLKPFKCNTCGLYCAQKINLKTHISEVHDGIKRAKPKREGWWKK